MMRFDSDQSTHVTMEVLEDQKVSEQTIGGPHVLVTERATLISSTSSMTFETIVSPSTSSNASLVDDPFKPTSSLVSATPKTVADSSSTAPEGSDEQKESSKPEPEEAEPEKETKKVWKSGAPLYCEVNGRPHATLIDFGIEECPTCNGDLTPPAAPEEVVEEAGPETKEEEQSEEPAAPTNTVNYWVEYKDAKDSTITTEAWDGPFDFAAARKDVKSVDQAIFDLTTVIGTSLTTDSYWYEEEVQKVMEKGILTNPMVAVRVVSTRIQLRSNPLTQVLRNLVKYYPSVTFYAGMTLESPFMVLGHHLQEIKEYLSAPDSVEDAGAVAGGPESQSAEKLGKEHLGILMGVMQDSLKLEMGIAAEQALHARGMCTFEMIWLLYKPGNTVYHVNNGRRSAYVVHSIERESIQDMLGLENWNMVMGYNVKLWNLKFDGSYVRRCEKSVRIPVYKGQRPIDSLKIVPCEFVDRTDGGKARRELEESGKLWYQLLQGRQVQYSGPLLDGSNRKFQGRVYVDPASYHIYAAADDPDNRNVQYFEDLNDDGHDLAKCLCDECRGLRPHPQLNFRWARYDVLDPNVERDLTLPDDEDPNHRYLLCDRLLWGFDLKSRVWLALDVANCSLLETNVRSIDTLVMPSERKEMIKALIHKFKDTDALLPSKEKQWGADFIENKGEGQIFLLHGSPGVGKTYTAECIAEHTGRPLLFLTCADIGTSEEVMEQRLQKWFSLAEKWGAVMLLDEADVFLEKRHVADLKRNSLVSVFLRCIEYYRGILFLTTNRVGHFDDAFMSRIHVIIYYDKLSADDRRKIWEQFFDKLCDEREEFVITGRAKAYVLEDEIVSKMEWNGREIRNAFQTAVALAEYRFLQKPNKGKNDHPTLDQRDFEQVCNMMRQFKQYLIDVHGHDEEERAFLARARSSGNSGHNRQGSRSGTGTGYDHSRLSPRPSGGNRG